MRRWGQRFSKSFHTWSVQYEKRLLKVWLYWSGTFRLLQHKAIKYSCPQLTLKPWKTPLEWARSNSCWLNPARRSDLWPGHLACCVFPEAMDNCLGSAFSPHGWMPPLAHRQSLARSEASSTFCLYKASSTCCLRCREKSGKQVSQKGQLQPLCPNADLSNWSHGIVRLCDQASDS